MLDEARGLLASAFGAPDILPVETPECSTCIRGSLLQAWARAAHDPGAHICEWLWKGAPAGITQLPELTGAFPLAPKDSEPGDDPDALGDDIASFTNYHGFEHDQEAVDEVRSYAEKGYLKVLRSLRAVKRYLKGRTPILSKFAVLKKVNNGRVKKRIILDLKQSGVTRCTRQTHRVVLPRASDVVHDILRMLSERQGDEDIESLVLDFVDAFWNIPLVPDERRHFVGEIRKGVLRLSPSGSRIQKRPAVMGGRHFCRAPAYPSDVRLHTFTRKATRADLRGRPVHDGTGREGRAWSDLRHHGSGMACAWVTVGLPQGRARQGLHLDRGPFRHSGPGGPGICTQRQGGRTPGGNAAPRDS